MSKNQKKKQQLDKKKKGNSSGQNQGKNQNKNYQQNNNQYEQKVVENFYKTSNMHSIFHQEYFEKGDDFPKYDLYNLIKRSLNKENVDSDFEKLFKSRNQQLSEFKFDLTVTPLKDFTDVVGYQKIQLKTTYPGLLIGTGYPHGFSAKGAIKGSLQFDYVTGLPNIPGSSLKGILRSAFPLSAEELASMKNLGPEERQALTEANQMKSDYMRDIVSALTEKEEVLELRDLIFGKFDWTDEESKTLDYQSSDIFLGGFPSTQNRDSKLLELEYITPHDKEGFKNPIPIPLLKVKPGIAFEFGFILKDTVLKNEKTISAAQKGELFTQILEDFGVGAKTNVGFGQLVKP